MFLLLGCILLLSDITYANVPAVYHEPVDVHFEEGGKLELKVPLPTNIWHRTFANGRMEYVEAPDKYTKISNVWRGGDMGSEHSPVKVEVGEDGTLRMPKVTAADAAKYFTYYFNPKGGDYHYNYFNVTIGK